MPDSNWEFGTGLREEYDFTIYMAYFGTDAAYGNGELTLLILQGVDENDEEARELFSVGKSWETLDGGKTIAFPEKPDKKINQNSMYAKFCQSALEACEKAKSTYLIDEGDPKIAQTWINTKWHMTQKEATRGFTNPSGEKVEARVRLLPETFLGRVTDDGEKVEAKPKTQTVAERRAVLAAKAKTKASGTPELTKLAKGAATFDDFVAEALALDEVVTDEVLGASVIDDSPEGYYATHH